MQFDTFSRSHAWKKLLTHFIKNARFIKLVQMTLNFNSRYAMKCNFSQPWIHNFQNFLGSMLPNPSRKRQKNCPRYAWKIFWGSTNFSLILNNLTGPVQQFSFSLTSANIFSAILCKAAISRCLWLVSTQTAVTANLMITLWPLNNERQRFPVTRHEVLFSDRIRLIQ